MAIDSSNNFTIQNNVLFGNTSFIGSNGPNCSSQDQTPTPEPFVMDQNLVTNSNIQSDFVKVPDGESLTCIVPSDGNFWPYGGGPPKIVVPGEIVPGSGASEGEKVGLGVGIPVGIVLACVLAWWFRGWYLERAGVSYSAGGGAGRGIGGVAGVAGGGNGVDMRTTPYPFGAGVGSESAVGHGARPA